jgi:hypothetical protein
MLHAHFKALPFSQHFNFWLWEKTLNHRFGRPYRHSVSCCFSRRRLVQGFAICIFQISSQGVISSLLE